MHESSTKLISPESLEAAQIRLEGRVRETPLLELPSADGAGQVWAKAENLRLTGSFKVRGALNAVLAATEQGAAGFVTYSAGNHGRALAHAARLAGKPATVVMPDTSTPNKVALTREAGAEVIVCDPDDIVWHAHELTEMTGATFIHPFDDMNVIAGQGTVGLELLRQLGQRELDVLLVPVGGGGLLSGIACAVKSTRPELNVVGVEPELAGDLAESFQRGTLTAWDRARTRRTIADGLRSPQAGTIPWAHVRQLVDDVLTVDESQILAALRTLTLHTNTIVEPSAAVAYAATVQHRQQFCDARTAVVMTGGNISVPEFAALF